jgi:hypothetical protein
VPSTTPSFVSPEFDFNLLSHAFSPSIRSGEISDSHPHSPLSDDDAAAMYDDIIRGAQAAAEQRTNRFNCCNSVCILLDRDQNFFFFLL